GCLPNRHPPPARGPLELLDVTQLVRIGCCRGNDCSIRQDPSRGDIRTPGGSVPGVPQGANDSESAPVADLTGARGAPPWVNSRRCRRGSEDRCELLLGPAQFACFIELFAQGVPELDQ